MEELVRSLASMSRSNLDKLMELQTAFNGRSGISGNGDPLLRILCFHGLAKTLRTICEQESFSSLRRRCEGLLEAQDTFGLTPLMHAAEIGMGNIADALINGGACVNQVSREGNTASHIAAKRGQVSVVQVLLGARDIDVDKRNDRDYTALHKAVIHDYGIRDVESEGHVSIVKQLIAHSKIGVHSQQTMVRSKDEKYWLGPIIRNSTPLITAWMKGTPVMFKELLQCPHIDGAMQGDWLWVMKSNVPEGVRGTMLHFISQTESELKQFDNDWDRRKARMLIYSPAFSASINLKNVKGQTPLAYAALMRHWQNFRLLLKHEAVDINEPTPDGLTVPMMAVRQNNVEIIRLLLSSNKMDYGAKDPSSGDSLLYEAISRGYVELAKVLLNSGKVDCADKAKNRALLEQAIKFGYPAVAEFIRSNMLLT